MFRLRKKQDECVPGLSDQARILRKNKNLVSMQFNMFNWLLETVSLILVAIVPSLLLDILYILVTSCGPPLVYYLGIEENRQQAKKQFQSRIRIFRKKAVALM